MTFMEREISGLIHHGWEVSVLALHGPMHVNYAAELDQSKVDKYYCLNRHLFSIRMLLSHVSMLITIPGKYFNSLICLFRYYSSSWYLFSRAIYAFLKAGYFYEIARSVGVKHIHAHFAGRTVDVAIFLSKFLEIEFSFTGHSNDVTGTYPLLQEKIHLASFVIAENQNAYDAVVSLIPHDNIDRDVHIIRPGVNTSFFKPSVDMQSDIPTLISVTRLVESKGLNDLVNACCQLKERGLDFVCHIVGDGPLFNELEMQIKELNLDKYIFLKGELPSTEILQLLNNSWIFVLPCIRVNSGQGDHPKEFVSVVEDGIPSSLVEAMSVGLPVVTTNVGALHELINSPINGMVVEQRNSDELARVLINLINDSSLRNELGDNARKTVMKDFDTYVCSKKLGSLILNTINKNKLEKL